MFNFKNFILIFFIFAISSCSFTNLHKLQNENKYSVEINTPNDKYNTYFKENLKRSFYIKGNVDKSYILKTTITFQSSDTLSVNGSNKLKSTKAKVEYQLKNKNTNTIIESGSVFTNPTLSSSSSSLYSQQKSIEHIKERLVKSSAKSLFMRINIILRKLS